MVDENHFEEDESIEHVREVMRRPADFITERPVQGRNEYLVLPRSVQPVRPSEHGNTTLAAAS